MQLISTNVFGQNTSAIAAAEAQYGEMWAQDSAAMYAYAGSSASASAVTPFSTPPQIANPTAQGTQAAAVATAAGTAQSTLTEMITGLPNALQSLTSPLLQSSNGPLSWLWQILFGTPNFPTSISALLTDLQPYASFFYNTEGLPYFSIGMGNNFIQSAKTLGLIGSAAPAAVAAAGDAAKGLPGLGGMLGGGPVAAGLGNAASVGKLSVPPVWSGPLPGSVTPGACSATGEYGQCRPGGGARKPVGRPAASWCGRGRRGSTLRIPSHRHGSPTLRRIVAAATY